MKLLLQFHDLMLPLSVPFSRLLKLGRRDRAARLACLPPFQLAYFQLELLVRRAQLLDFRLSRCAISQRRLHLVHGPAAEFQLLGERADLVLQLLISRAQFGKLG